MSMNVLMLSLDRGLLGKGQLGDVVERHKLYGDHIQSLDIIVLCKKGFGEYKISHNVKAYPTNSFNKVAYIVDGKDLGEKLISKKNYNLIVAQDPFLCGWIGLKLKTKFKKKLLVHLHGDYFENPYWLKESPKNRFLVYLAKYVLQKADGIRVMSLGQKEKLMRAKRIKPEQKVIEVVSTPVNVERFSGYDNDSFQEKLLKRISGKRMVLMVGRKDAIKDFETLFQAMSIVFEKRNNVGLWLVGNYTQHELRGYLSQQPKQLIICEGDIDTKDLPAYYFSSYLVVLSSRSESFGKVLVEANACGKAVVATKTTGAQDIIQDGYNGFLVSIGDAEMFAQKIIYLLDNPIVANDMGYHGKKLVFEKFQGQKNIEKIIQLWKRVSV